MRKSRILLALKSKIGFAEKELKISSVGAVDISSQEENCKSKIFYVSSSPHLQFFIRVL